MVHHGHVHPASSGKGAAAALWCWSALSLDVSVSFLLDLQRTCVDKILGLGECPPKDLKIEEEWGPEDLNLRLFFLFF